MPPGSNLIVATPDGRPPKPDPFGLEARFHYDDEDEDFLNSVVRSFGEDPEDIRITLHQMTELGMIGARRIQVAAVESGIDPDTARAEIEAAAKAGWYGDIPLTQAIDDAGGVVAGLGRARLVELLDATIAASEAEAARVTEWLASNEALNNPRDLREITEAELTDCDPGLSQCGRLGCVSAARQGTRRSRDRLIELVADIPAALRRS